MSAHRVANDPRQARQTGTRRSVYLSRRRISDQRYPVSESEVPMTRNTAPVTLREITDDNRAAALAVRVAAEQERFVGSVRAALADATEYPQANPWYRAVYAAHEPVGFVMVSWNVQPQPPTIIGPWFLWKLLIDHRHQGRGYGTQVVHQ